MAATANTNIGNTIADIGLVTSIFGGVTNAIGSFYNAQIQQVNAKAQTDYTNFQLESQSNLAQVQGLSQYSQLNGQAVGYESEAATADWQRQLSELNAKQSEYAAQMDLRSGQRQIGASTARAGQRSSSARAAMAANGIVLGEGNAAEVIATNEITKMQDSMTISANASRAAWAERIQAENYRSQAAMLGVSAGNLRTSASNARATAEDVLRYSKVPAATVMDTSGQYSSTLAAATSLLSGATTVTNAWYKYNRPPYYPIT